MVESFLDAFRDYGSSVALAVLSEMTETVLPDREPSDANFRLLLLAAQTVKHTGKPDCRWPILLLWTVKLGGWLPPLDACARCGRALGPEGSRVFFAERFGDLLQQVPQAGNAHAFARALGAARKMLAERLDRLSEEMISPRAARELTDVMLDVIEHQIDRKLASRELLESLA